MHPSGRGAEVATGAYRLGTRRVNWYVVEGDDGLLAVDAGLPGHWRQLVDHLHATGYGLHDVEAMVLAHGHTDHVGFAERLRTTAGVPVLVDEADAALARGEGEMAPGEVLVNLWRPALLGMLYEFARDGGLSVPWVEAVEPFEAGARLDVPGEPRVINVPGHSAGSCAPHFEERDALLRGDVLATFDIKTGRSDGPQLVSRFNEDRGQAVASPDRIESVGDVTLLPGHG